MHPAITFKRIAASAPGCEYQVIKPFIADDLCIHHPVIVIIVAIITDGAYKFPVQNVNEVIIYIHYLAGAAQ